MKLKLPAENLINKLPFRKNHTKRARIIQAVQHFLFYLSLFLAGYTLARIQSLFS